VDFKDVEFVGFMDLIPERAKDKRDRAGQGAVYESYTEMLDKSTPDALYVGVTPAEHGEIEYEAIKRKIHMLIEKPMAIDNNMAEDICKKAADAKIIAAVAFQDRYLDLVAQCKEWMKGKKNWPGGRGLGGGHTRRALVSALFHIRRADSGAKHPPLRHA
jgi:predicted dehydrogenase